MSKDWKPKWFEGHWQQGKTKEPKRDRQYILRSHAMEGGYKKVVFIK